MGEFQTNLFIIADLFSLNCGCTVCCGIVSGAMQRPLFFHVVLLQHNLPRAAVCVKLDPR